MNIGKFFTRHRLWGAAILCVLLVAACGPAPLGTGWPAISLLSSQCGDQSQLNVVVAFNDRIVMVNPADGKPMVLLNQECEARPPDAEGKLKVWDFRGDAPNLFFSDPLRLDDDTLLVAGYNQHIYEIELPTARSDSPTGTAISERAGHTVAELVNRDDLLYLGLGTKDLVALNSADYQIEWTVPTEHGVWSQPLLVGNSLYFTSLDHKLYAVDAETGEAQWTLDLEGAVTSTPVLYNDHLYIGSFGRKIFEIGLDGQVVNQYATVDWVWSAPVIVDDILYAADLGGNVYALNLQENLEEVWKQKAAASAIRPTPLVTDEFVVVASRDQKVYWLNRADGTIAGDSEGQPLVRELTAQILSDVLLVEPSESVNIPEPYIIVSTLSPSELLVAYTLERGQYVWTYGFS